MGADMVRRGVGGVMTERQATFGYYSSLVMLGVGAALLIVGAIVGIDVGWVGLDSLGWSLMYGGLCIAISAWLLMSVRLRVVGWCVFAAGVAPLAIMSLSAAADLAPTTFVVSETVEMIVRLVSSAVALGGIILLLPVIGTRDRMIAWIAALLLIFATVLNFYGWANIGDLRLYSLSVSAALDCVVGLCLLWLAGTMFKLAKHRTHDGESSLPQRLHIDIACPRCGERHGLTPGETACPGCKLRFRLELEEQRCACGYLLIGLAAETCPECGKEIPESLRWRRGEGESESAGASPESSRVSPHTTRDDHA
ncbi:MAG: hypothetical protein EA376_13400 [Phycisphaeraceae bacterium]|nr:MAG: hypothetical protein EA376_13400 [Phycisphaeraceae bacterium]